MRTKKIKFLTGLLRNLCNFMISLPHPLLSVRIRVFGVLMVAVFFRTRKIQPLFCEQFLLWKTDVSPVYCRLTSACTTVIWIKCLFLLLCKWDSFWCLYKSRAIYQDLSLTSISYLLQYFFATKKKNIYIYIRMFEKNLMKNHADKAVTIILDEKHIFR